MITVVSWQEQSYWCYW